MNIYTAEKDLAEQLQHTSIAYVSPVIKPSVMGNNGDVVLKALAEQGIVKSSVYDSDLYYTQSILVSTNWNKNDDVFGKEQVWPARFTPAHKPTNLNHDEQLIVGHITDSIFAIDSEGSIISSNAEIDKLPDLFHIVNGAVIYRGWGGKDLKARAEKLIEEIENGEKYVSMECLFTDFDYAAIKSDGTQYLIRREEQTAFLTKHLRIYGGEGSHNGEKIGRYLKNITFIGKGYVDKPANPNSIIFDKNNLFFSKSYVLDVEKDKNNSILLNDGVLTNSEEVGPQNNKEIKFMAEAIEKQLSDMQEQLKTAIAENKQLQKQLADADVKKLEAQIKEQSEKINSLTEAQTKFDTERDELRTEKDKLQAKIDEQTKANDEMKAELEKVKAAEIENKRISMLVDGGIAKETAADKVVVFSNLNDEQFNVVAQEMIAAKKSCTEEDEKKKKMKEKEAESSVEGEVDASESKATEEVLENADASEEIEITGGSNTNEVEELRKELATAIAQTFGVKTKNKEN
jgi:hypothetical protein